MANSFFSTPNIHFGENAVAPLQRLNSKKVAIITDNFMVESGLIHRHLSN